MFEDISQTGQSGGLNGGYSDSGQLYKILEGKGKNYNEICTGWHFRNSFEFTLYGLHHALVILKANVEGWESWGGQKLLQGAHCSNISLCVWEFFIITTEIQIAMTSRAIDYALNQGPDVHLWCSLWRRWWESVLPPPASHQVSLSASYWRILHNVDSTFISLPKYELPFVETSQYLEWKYIFRHYTIISFLEMMTHTLRASMASMSPIITLTSCHLYWLATKNQYRFSSVESKALSL